MEFTPHSASQTLPTAHNDVTRTRTEDLVYQIVTIAAILLVLGSLWVF
jgi:hypothetical protein